MSSKPLFLDSRLDRKSKWHPNLLRRPLEMIKRMERAIPQDLKQKGIVRILTPMMLFPRLTISRNAMSGHVMTVNKLRMNYMLKTIISRLNRK